MINPNRNAGYLRAQLSLWLKSQEMKILVRNIAKLVTHQELLAIFEDYGKVQYCKLVEDKGSAGHKGFGFVEMPNPGNAKAAIKNLNGKELKGMVLRVKKSEPKAEAEPSPWTSSTSASVSEKESND